jgi:hypothetical protein
LKLLEGWNNAKAEKRPLLGLRCAISISIYIPTYIIIIIIIIIIYNLIIKGGIDP